VLNVYELLFSEAILNNVICKIPSGVSYCYCLWHVCAFIIIIIIFIFLFIYLFFF